MFLKKKKYCILGIGLNVNSHRDFVKRVNQQACSLYTLLKKKVKLEEVLKKFISFFASFYHLFVKEGFEAFIDLFISYSDLIGREVIFWDQGEKLGGIVKEMKADKTLIVELIRKEKNDKSLKSKKIDKKISFEDLIY